MLVFNKKNAIFLFTLVFLVASCTTPANQPVACTEEAKICPDGTAVVRVGPNCEFEKCPTEQGEEDDRENKECDYDSPTKKYVAKSVEQCSLIEFACESGEPFSDECGCGCIIDKTDQEPKEEETIDPNTCTREQKENQVCTREYVPVCGDDGRTYGNKCEACASKRVDKWTEGECKNNQDEDLEENKNFCTTDQRNADACIQIYQPVCGWFNQNIQCIKYPCAQTYSNSCVACQNSQVEYWTDGECPQ